jgi:lipopolysaccharide export system protein LptA
MRSLLPGKGLASQGLQGPWDCGRKGRSLSRVLLMAMFVVSSATGWALEGKSLAPLAEKTLGKTFPREGWNADAPVDIQSEQLTVDFETHKIVFKGGVKVLQLDFSLSANEVTATFGETADDIVRIIASGDVTIQKADKMAWGEQAIYDRESATILLTGSPVLRQGRNFIKGREIRVHLDEDRMEVMGGVEAEFLLSEQRGDSHKETP